MPKNHETMTLNKRKLIIMHIAWVVFVILTQLMLFSYLFASLGGAVNGEWLRFMFYWSSDLTALFFVTLWLSPILILLVFFMFANENERKFVENSKVFRILLFLYGLTISLLILIFLIAMRVNESGSFWWIIPACIILFLGTMVFTSTKERLGPASAFLFGLTLPLVLSASILFVIPFFGGVVIKSIIHSIKKRRKKQPSFEAYKEENYHDYRID